jgi:hypothetical protein
LLEQLEKPDLTVRRTHVPEFSYRFSRGNGTKLSSYEHLHWEQLKPLLASRIDKQDVGEGVLRDGVRVYFCKLCDTPDRASRTFHFLHQ